MSAFLDHVRNGDGEPNLQAETMAESLETMVESLEYGRLKQRSDRRNARRDARRGLPVYAKQPAPTPTVRRLFAEYVQLVAAERLLWDQEAAPLRGKVATLDADIKAIKEDLARAQQRFDITQKTTTNGVGDDGLTAWRRKTALEAEWNAREEKHRRLASAQAKLQERKADIESCYNQHLDRQNQIVGHIWLRIETYLAELIRVHPDGNRLNAVIEWGPAGLASTLEQLTGLDEQLIKRDQPRKAIEPPERD